jgi:aryl-alcohol dehydrogenase
VAARFGATTVDPTEVESVVERVKELTGGGARYAIDTTAIPAVVTQAQRALAPRGTLVALGLGAEEYVLDAIDLLQGGKTVRSSIEGDSDPQEMVPRLLAMRAAGAFPMDDLVTTYPAEQINQAVADVTSGAVVKPVLVW